MAYLQVLPAGTLLGDQFAIDRVLGQGGFGITYLAQDVGLHSTVVIKEYFPSQIAVREGQTVHPRATHDTEFFNWGLERFIQEARILDRCRHPNIVGVRRVFESNATGYMALNHEDGPNFEAWLTALGRPLTQAEIDQIAWPLLDALDYLHTLPTPILHRDIAPDNIIMRTAAHPVLIDFGAARQGLANKTQSSKGAYKLGYSPLEQQGQRFELHGPWTDIYALAATLQRALSGRVPQPATDRVLDDLMGRTEDMIVKRGLSPKAYRPQFLTGLDAAMTVLHKDRPHSVAHWRQQLFVGALEPVAVQAVRPVVDPALAIDTVVVPQPTFPRVVNIAPTPLPTAPPAQAGAGPVAPQVAIRDAKPLDRRLTFGFVAAALCFLTAFGIMGVMAHRLGLIGSGTQVLHQQSEVRREAELAARAEQQNSIEAQQTYLAAFPNGAHAGVVRQRLKLLQDDIALKRAAEARIAQEELRIADEARRERARLADEAKRTQERIADEARRERERLAADAREQAQLRGLDDDAVCRRALDNAHRDWSRDESARKYVSEALRRSLTIDTCRTTLTPETTDDTFKVCSWLSEYVNLRSGPSNGDSIIRRVDNYTSVAVIGEEDSPTSGHKYFKVRLADGTEGYMDHELVSDDCEAYIARRRAEDEQKSDDP